MNDDDALQLLPFLKSGACSKQYVFAYLFKIHTNHDTNVGALSVSFLNIYIHYYISLLVPMAKWRKWLLVCANMSSCVCVWDVRASFRLALVFFFFYVFQFLCVCVCALDLV